jgi:phosphoribosylformimino-5-aminoimidazole carboxamide ribotide isomerase
VIASGGVGSLQDLIALRLAAAGSACIEGVIIGRALYDGRIAIDSALKALQA